jgi:hypothetical protein
MKNVDIQDDSEGNVSIFGGGSIGHVEKGKVHMNVWLILNAYREKGRVFLNVQIQKTLRMKIKGHYC